MCTIDLQQILETRTFPEAGNVVYDIIASKIDNEDKININLEGVVSLPSMFLNVSIGRIIEVYGVDVLKQKVLFSQISAQQVERIKDYINKITAN